MQANISSLSLAVLMIAAYQNLPLSTPDGDITHVAVGERPTSSALAVNMGDEIRWTNTSMGTVRIVFMEPISRQVSCRRHFCGYFTGGLEAILAPNESASLCFGKSGDIHYTITLRSLMSHAPVSRSGSLHVGVRHEAPSPQSVPTSQPSPP
ncbi:hypothetical protein YTPLAS72_00860 [Nitrospira sp.]|nr:hypothetical protein YTPLAS72_00860 [Nitrospira sp.]